jgi:hypothetical protein
MQESANRDRLIGTWKLVSAELTIDGTVILPLGENPIGRLTYEAAGRMSAQLMRRGRVSSVTDPASIPQLTADELRHIAEGYIGYFGSFEIEGTPSLTTSKPARFPPGRERCSGGSSSSQTIACRCAPVPT